MRTLRSGRALQFVADGRTAFEPVLPRDHRGPASPDAPLGLRVRVLLTRGRLDRQIAAGHPSDGAAELALRSRQLADPRTQREIARNLRGVLRYAERRGSRRALSCVLTRPSAVRAGKPAIAELAEQLERGGSVNPRGVVLASALLTDAASPLFNRYGKQSVSEAARAVQGALE